MRDKCIPNEALSASGRRRKADRVFPTGIDRCLFVFAIGPDSINPVCVRIALQPCQHMSERKSVRLQRKRAEGREDKEEVPVVGMMRSRRVWAVKWAFYSF